MQNRTILFVDDCRELRILLCAFLQRSGYKVLDAPDGLSAYETALEYPGVIDLLVTDVEMPRMGGLALSVRLQHCRPEIKVLFISGNGKSFDAEGAFLPKPFSPSALLQKVEALFGVVPLESSLRAQ